MAGGIDWFRWHHGSANDQKFQLVAKRSGASVAECIAVWACLLEAASVSEDRGNPGETDFEAMDCALGISDGLSETIYTRMQERGLIADSRIAAWDKRQPKREREDDTSAERKRRQREKEASQIGVTSDVTPCHTTSHQKTPRGEERREDQKLMSGKPDVAEVLTYLNQKAKRDYRAVDSNLKLIAARLGEGATVAECKAVIDAKVKEWLHDPKMTDYLRPETLFGATKFAGYVGKVKGVQLAADGGVVDSRFKGAI